MTDFLGVIDKHPGGVNVNMKQKKLLKKKHHLAIVGVIFDREGKVLLTKRNEPKSTHSHGKWQLPGGGIRHGEHPINTLHREIKEETGIDVELISTQPLVHSQMFEKENIHVLLLAFPAKYISGNLDISKDKATGDAKWYSIDEIDYTVCLPQVKEILYEAKKYLT